MPTINLKIGHIEVSYDGEQAFIEKGLLKLVQELGELPVGAAAVSSNSNKGTGTLDENGAAFGHTTSQIAQITSASTGPDLAMAAMAHLTLAKGQSKIQRGDILSEMKGAAAFYKETYSSNLSSILNGLVKKKVVSPISANVFALPHGVRKSFEEKLSND